MNSYLDLLLCFSGILVINQLLLSNFTVELNRTHHLSVMSFTARCYSRLDLLSCQPLKRSSYRPDNSVVCEMKRLGIWSMHRGKRAGQPRARIKDKNAGIHWDNLRNIPVTEHRVDLDNQNTLNNCKKKNLCIASFNAQSLGPQHKQLALKEFILDQDIDIMMVQETWLKKSGDEAKIACMTPPGYTTKSFPRSHHGGGLAIVFRSTLSKHLSFITDFPFCHASFEVVQITLSESNRTVHFWNLYRTFPSKKNKLTDSLFLQEFQEMLDHCNSIHSSSIIYGDLNFHYDEPNRSNTSKMINILETFDLVQAIKESTHNRGHIIDWIIHRSQDSYIKSTSVKQELSSDHFCVLSTLDIEPPLAPKLYKDVRKLRSMDRDAFRQDLRVISPDTCPTIETLNAQLGAVLDRHAPVTRKEVKPNRSDPWYAEVKDELREAKRQRRVAERKWLQTGLTVFKEIFAKTKRHVTHVIQKAKTTFYSFKIADCESSKQLFGICDTLSGRERTSPLPIIHPVQEQPDLFNDFFTTKVANIRAKLDEVAPLDSQVRRPVDVDLPCKFGSFRPISETDLRSIIIRSKPTTCPTDPIPTPLFMECLDQLLPAVTSIVNDSLSSGIFPTQSKTAIVKPLLKKAGLDQNVLKNFRPVSNLSFLSKVMEKAVLQQLLEYLNDNSLLCPNQSAYRASHSTETALVKVTSDLLLALDSGKVSLLTLLDLSAAFDTVDHEILLQTLNTHFGISGIALSWFRSYLSDRTQRIKIDEYNSKPTNVIYGVPQGSVLGPVLFVMYTKPLFLEIDRRMIPNQSFADDTQLYKACVPSEIQSTVLALQDCITDIKEWMTCNKLKLNDDKTEVLLLHNPRSFPCHEMPSYLRVGEFEVSFSDSARDLGYTITDTMSLDAHITNVCRSAYLAIRQIGTIRHFLTEDATRKLVCAFVLSRLDYCNSLLSGCPKYLIDKLQKVQNSAARLIFKTRKRDHISPLLKSLHWLPVQARIDYKLSVLCHNFFSGSAPKYFDQLLSVYTPSRQLRSSTDSRLLCVPRVRTVSFGERSFYFCGPKQWNSLPLHVRNIQSTSSFKKALKTYLFNKYHGL